ncbi:MBL fold metallo-hydrolase [bacterium]|nr:MBL fold metallo-hydrolase [bacterium]
MGKVRTIFLVLLFSLAACTGTSGQAEKNSGKAEQGQAQASGSAEQETETEKEGTVKNSKAKLLYMGHASLRITTAEGKVIYIDPFAGEGYEPAADLILVTHAHHDHNALDKIKNRSEGHRIITWKEALADGKHQTFDLGYVRIEAVEAGYNKNHDVKECVGYILTLSDGVTVYVSGDTSKTNQMPALAEKKLDYAFYCCDGVYNMDLPEAAECAKLVGAKHDIPYHVIAASGGKYFDRVRAEQFDSPNRLVIGEGEEIELVSGSGNQKN